MTTRQAPVPDPAPVPRISRVLPVPGWSPDGFGVFSAIISTPAPALALHGAFRAGRLAAGDLQQAIADIWTRTDSPTADLDDNHWVEMFRALGFFSWPPLATHQLGGPSVPFRPASPLTLYRGSTAGRARRMSWASDRAVAEELGRRHGHYEAAALYQATVAPDMVLAFLERRDDGGWTIVVDPAGLTAIHKLEDINPRQPPA